MHIVRRSLFGLAALSVLTFGWGTLLPAPTFACSCAQTAIASLDTTQNQIYVAAAGQAGPQGTTMAVETWFAGPGAAPVVLLGASSFGDSAGCRTEPLPPGSRWIMSAWVGDPAQPPTTGLCQPHARLDTPEGQAMLAEAETAYGPGSLPEGGPTDGSDDGAPVGLLMAISLGIVVMLALAVVLAARRDRADMA